MVTFLSFYKIIFRRYVYLILESFTIITNNPMMSDSDFRSYIEFYNVSIEGILQIVRKRIHKGFYLLTHPLSGSVKPTETPYKSVMITNKDGNIDMLSLKIIESALESCNKFNFKTYKYDENILKDFQLIDFELMKSALSSCKFL